MKIIFFGVLNPLILLPCNPFKNQGHRRYGGVQII